MGFKQTIVCLIYYSWLLDFTNRLQQLKFYNHQAIRRKPRIKRIYLWPSTSPFPHPPSLRCPEGPGCGSPWRGGAHTTSRCPWFQTSLWSPDGNLPRKRRKQRTLRAESPGCPWVTLGELVCMWVPACGEDAFTLTSTEDPSSTHIQNLLKKHFVKEFFFPIFVPHAELSYLFLSYASCPSNTLAVFYCDFFI